jgi:hypothetical protein
VVRTLVDALAQVLEAFLAESFNKSAIAVGLMLRTGHLRSTWGIVASEA